MERVVQVIQPVGDDGVVKKFESPRNNKKDRVIIPLIAILVVLGGVGTGYYFSKMGGNGKIVSESVVVDGSGETAGESEVVNIDLFPDSASGVLKEGGIDGEGTHYLDRGLGEEKYVYLFSTVIDLDGFVGKKVEVWGNTVSGQKAGWLMDVGKIKEAN